MASPTFQLEIITPEKLAYSDSVDMVTAPTAHGQVGILAHHVPLFSRLMEGEVKVTKGNDEYYLAIGGGFIEVTPDRVSVLVTRAVNSHELNEEEIKKAEARAKNAVENATNSDELIVAQATLRRALLDMKVLRRKRSHGTLS